MGQPLNPALYRRLKRHFGNVRIANEGQAFVATPIRGLDNGPRLEIAQDGEYYRVSCPYCSDTRFRLYISHMFGKKDAFKRRMTFLATCFNEGCLYRRENQEDLIETLEDSGEWLDDLPVEPGEVLPEEARTVLWPGPSKLLDKLPEGHAARQYLEFDRAFNSDSIAKHYKVGYCTDSRYFLARNRLIIPVYEGEELKGWQARYVGELPWKDKTRRKDLPPKYFSCPNSQFRSRCIYNWDRMKQYRTGVVVEGPTDVWRFGFMSGCVFGNTMTPAQKSKVHTVFSDPRRTLILLLDPEEFNKEATQKLIEWWETRIPKRFCAVKLPADTDPGSLDRKFLRGYVEAKAKKHGVRVYYEKVA